MPSIRSVVHALPRLNRCQPAWGGVGQATGRQPSGGLGRRRVAWGGGEETGPERVPGDVRGRRSTGGARWWRQTLAPRRTDGRALGLAKGERERKKVRIVFFHNGIGG